VLGIAALLAALLSAGAQPAAPPLQRVTLIGDSVADSLVYVPSARAILAQGVDLQLQVEPCRRLDGESCPYQGKRPSNVLQLVASLGDALGDNVIVAVGYNDYESLYAQNIEDVLAALKKAGVKRVLWPTLRAAYHSYLTMNDAIEAAAQKHPEMTVVDWNLYSRSHPDWFQQDGIHLNADGANSLATLLHKTLLDLGIAAPPPPPPLQILTTKLPDAFYARPYATRLRAQGGTAPYRWTPVSALPKGLIVRPDGRLVGKPLVRPSRNYPLRLRVTDAAGKSVTRPYTLHVRP
jgi:hypothetical protein